MNRKTGVTKRTRIRIRYLVLKKLKVARRKIIKNAIWKMRFNSLVSKNDMSSNLNKSNNMLDIKNRKIFLLINELIIISIYYNLLFLFFSKLSFIIIII